MATTLVRLKQRQDRRVRSGHPWVFSNEIDGDVRALEPGALVDVATANGKFLGRGYANPNSLIAIRLLSRNRHADPSTPEFYASRLQSALKHRQAVYPKRTAYRWINSEADGLPGLIIDRFNDVLSVQINTLGMDVRRDLLETAIRSVLDVSGAVFRNDSPMRILEGLQQHKDV